MNLPSIWIAYESNRLVDGDVHKECGYVNESGVRTPMRDDQPFNPDHAYQYPLGPKSQVEWAVDMLTALTAFTPSGGWDSPDLIKCVWNTACENDIWREGATVRYRCRLAGFSVHDLLDIAKMMRLKQRSHIPCLEFDRYDLVLRSQLGNERQMKGLDIPADVPGYELRDLASRLFNETEGEGFPADDLPFDEGQHTWIHKFAFNLKAHYR
ncbi:hypothetical protein [Halomonas sp. KO116]|uniref:hypothetical protein n=1 Tax=Halomonas sp. KO116 TaxID=1504981 RepID=UPI0004E2A0E0|nr:hypothetical protein [Halomonas sp. KO116]AJY53149.1 hypothetical protein KO116_P200042 [Halomonas sp. KO116]